MGNSNTKADHTDSGGGLVKCGQNRERELTELIKQLPDDKCRKIIDFVNELGHEYKREPSPDPRHSE